MKILIVYGTRPEVIKLSPVIEALKAYPKIQTVLVNTGQQLDLSNDFAKQFNIAPHYNLGIMVKNQSLNHIVSKCVGALDKVLVKEMPDMVVVQGDTTTSLAGALAGFNRDINVGHIEAGLRSFNKFSPYPEELNRVLISQIATWHFAPTKGNARNLEEEGVKPSHVFVTGNTSIDIVKNTPIDEGFQNLMYSFASGKKIITLTLHRRENHDKVEHYVGQIAEFLVDKDDVCCVWPCHPNPKVKQIAKRITEDYGKGLRIVEPLSYQKFISLMDMSCLVLTDSGGCVEELTVLKRPLIILRQETERPEVLTLPYVKLVEKSLYNQLEQIYCGKTVLTTKCKNSMVFGKGGAGKKIAKILSKLCT